MAHSLKFHFDEPHQEVPGKLMRLLNYPEKKVYSLIRRFGKELLNLAIQKTDETFLIDLKERRGYFFMVLEDLENKL